MEDEVKDEVQGDAGDVPAPPVPEVASSTVAGSDAATVERLAAMEKTLSELPDMIDSRFKSTKDKSVAGLVNKVEEIVSWVEQAGGDPNKIRTDLQISELKGQVAAFEGPGGAVGTAPTGDAQSLMQGDSTKILNEAGIAFDDPEYLQLVTENAGAGRENWNNTLSVFAVRRARKGLKSGSVTAAAAVIESGAAPVAGAEETSLQGELQSFYDGDHGSLAKPENSKRLKEISAELNKLSPPVNA